MMQPMSAGGMPGNMQQQQMQMQQQAQQQQQQQPQQQQPGPQQQGQQQRQEDKLIAKARELVGPLKEKWALTLKEGANKINHANPAPDAKESNAAAVQQVT